MGFHRERRRYADLFKIMALFLLLVHWLGCFWYFVGVAMASGRVPFGTQPYLHLYNIYIIIYTCVYIYMISIPLSISMSRPLGGRGDPAPRLPLSLAGSPPSAGHRCRIADAQ